MMFCLNMRYVGLQNDTNKFIFIIFIKFFILNYYIYTAFIKTLRNIWRFHYLPLDENSPLIFWFWPYILIKIFSENNDNELQYFTFRKYHQFILKSFDLQYIFTLFLKIFVYYFIFIFWNFIILLFVVSTDANLSKL